MDIALWTVTALLLFVVFVRDSWRYWAATRKARGKPFVASLTEVFTGKTGDHMFEHQTDPAMESMRRRIWLEWGCCAAYAFLGFAFWRAVVGVF
ncbi:MAG TPA: hypothetical protein VF361_00225 [Candidatus Limnocylindrales bacterium]